MSAPAHTEASLRETLQLVRQYGSVSAAARATGTPEGTLRSRYQAASRLGDPAVRPPSQTVTAPDSVAGTANQVEVTRIVPRRVRTLADLIDACEIDTAEWEIERFVCNKWEAASKDNDGKAHVQDLYQVKAWLRRKVHLVAAKDEIASLLADAKKQMGGLVKPAPKRKKAGGGYMLEINIPDLHVGKLAWAEETGGANYDSRIAERIFDEALSALLARTASYTFEEILLVVGNDLLHSDTKQGTTYGGTPLDTDSRYQKSFRLVRLMITRAVERCRLVAPVRVILVPGNHDTQSVWHLGDSLECWYHGVADVHIDNRPRMRKYHRFGSVMLLFTHGDKGKRENYPLLMATEEPEMFGATRHRETHTGHLHQLRVQEHMGVRVRIVSSLSPADAWHAENQFVGNARSAEAFIWHKDEGLVGTAYYTVTEGTADAA